MTNITKKNWDEFRETGLVLFVNSFLHIFGWALVVELSDDDPNKVINVYPARVPFRGFSESSVENAYKKISKYMMENAQELKKEAFDEDDKGE